MRCGTAPPTVPAPTTTAAPAGSKTTPGRRIARRRFASTEKEKEERITWMWRRSTAAWIVGSDDGLEEGRGWVGRSGAVGDAKTSADDAARDVGGGTSADGAARDVGGGTSADGTEPMQWSGGARSAADMDTPPHRAVGSGFIGGE